MGLYQYRQQWFPHRTQQLALYFSFSKDYVLALCKKTVWTKYDKDDTSDSRKTLRRQGARKYRKCPSRGHQLR